MFELFAELILEIVAEVILAFGWESVVAPFRRRERSNAALAAVGYILFGGILGAVSAWLIPHRVSQNDAISVLSLIFNPIVAGFALDYYGAARRRKNRSTTNLATFAGGAAFALGISLSRFLLTVMWSPYASA